MVVGEIRAEVERLRGRDPVQSSVYEIWLQTLGSQYGSRVLQVTNEIADRWGRLNFASPLPVIDGLLAATALVHSLTLVKRNVKNFKSAGVSIFNPFSR